MGIQDHNQIDNGETPFSLAYGYKAMVLVETELGHYEGRITNQSRMRPCNSASLISSKRNDVTLNSRS